MTQPIEILETTPLPSFEQLIKRELTKYDTIVPAINELKENFLPLKIDGMEDKEGYEKVTKALRFMVKKRNEIDDKRKELKADSLKYGAAVDNKAKEIMSELNPIEEYLKGEKTRIDEEIKAAEELIKAEVERKKKRRHQDLVDIGMMLIGNEYIWNNPNNPIDNISFHSLNLETMDDVTFASFIKNSTVLIDNAITEYQKEVDRRNAERLAFEQKQKELEQQQKDIEAKEKAMKDEMAAMKQERTNTRNKYLIEAGAKLINGSYLFDKHELIGYATMADMGADTWVVALDEILERIKEYKEENEKILADAKVEADRKMAEIRKEAAEKAQRDLEQQKKEEAEKEAMRLLMLNDKQKFAEYINAIMSIQVPVFKSKTYPAYVTEIVAFLNKLLK
jgi:vacuolar-type H+-ATPase subunit H